jgi:hypothetical protein
MLPLGAYQRASAQGTAAPPTITISAGYATFSYGLVTIHIEVSNALNDTSTFRLTIYDPDGNMIGDKDETLIFNEDDGKSYFTSYYFGIDRKYVSQSYKIDATYAGQKSSYQLQPFSSVYHDPPIVTARTTSNPDGSVSIFGMMSGGLAGEEGKILIYHPDDDSIVYNVTVQSTPHALIDHYIDAQKAEALFGNRDYKVVLVHVATGAQGETLLSYLNPNAPDQNTTNDTNSSGTDETNTSGDPTPAPNPEESNDQSSKPKHDNDGSHYSGAQFRPFIFKDPETGSASVLNGTESIEDVLTLNGTITSYLLVYRSDNGTITATKTIPNDSGIPSLNLATSAMVSNWSSLFLERMPFHQSMYNVSGNWSMAVKDDMISDFGANFTVVQTGNDTTAGIANGTSVSYSLNNFTSVNASQITFGNGTIMNVSSTVDLRTSNNITPVKPLNVTIILQKSGLNLIEIDNKPIAKQSLFPELIYARTDYLEHDGTKSYLPP